MAQEFPTELLVLGGLGIGAYFLYQWWTSQQVAASTGTPVLTQGSINVITPAGGEPSAAQLQTQLNRLSATASDWNTAYTSLTGRSIDSLYGFSWNSVYGPSGSTQMTASAFLSMAKATGLSPHITLSGIGNLFRGPVYRPMMQRWRW